VSDYLLGIIVGSVIGGVIALLSVFLNDHLRASREEKKWKLQSAHEFFRRLYEPLAPLFSAPYEFMFAMLLNKAYQIKDLSKEEQQQISSNLERVLSKILDAYKHLVDKGYIGLFPKDLGGMILGFCVRIEKSNKLIKERGIIDEETLDSLSEILPMADKLRDRMRQLLNVDALD